MPILIAVGFNGALCEFGKVVLFWGGGRTMLEYLLHRCFWYCLLNKPIRLWFHFPCKIFISNHKAVSAFCKDLTGWGHRRSFNRICLSVCPSPWVLLSGGTVDFFRTYGTSRPTSWASFRSSFQTQVLIRICSLQGEIS